MKTTLPTMLVAASLVLFATSAHAQEEKRAAAGEAHEGPDSFDAEMHPTHPTWSFAAAIGAEAATVVSLPHRGPTGMLAYGMETPHRYVGLNFRYAYDRTPEGLTIHDAQTGADLAAILGPVRLGGGASVMLFDLVRKSQEEGTIAHFGTALNALASVDFMTYEGGALSLGLRGDAAWLFPSTRLPPPSSSPPASTNPAPGVEVGVGEVRSRACTRGGGRAPSRRHPFSSAPRSASCAHRPGR